MFFFPAVCENKATGFLVLDNTILSTADSIVYKDTPEQDCFTTCSTNRDQFGRSILCASFVYDHSSFTCTIFKEKAKPEGKADVVQVVGKRYFEKVCLGEEAPKECADSQFIRADDSVLIGFARNVTLVETMEQCVGQCVQEKDCKSAMYFYEEGECITNSESALSKPSSFAKEENEKVVYFQNGCLTKTKAQDYVLFRYKKHPKSYSLKASKLSREKQSKEFPTYFSEWSDWTACTKAGERQIRRRKCLNLRRCLGALMQLRNCPAVLPDPVREFIRLVKRQKDTTLLDIKPSTSSVQPEAVWSSWQGVCQHFVSAQPCNNGEMIGFESRECIAKDPSLCEGPFFRYCTLPC
ncbi:unnamed protein product [Angiostrongylus costaricensis]|uniref:Apple domain-containing protein n=1 Tax=Angiostrongylus costaricensis TaxID=334426 RepID=A0A3P7HR75_ANGCS|nr:unnamed protein product [Angiostrongylus costaricensis]